MVSWLRSESIWAIPTEFALAAGFIHINDRMPRRSNRHLRHRQGTDGGRLRDRELVAAVPLSAEQCGQMSGHAARERRQVVTTLQHGNDAPTSMRIGN